MLTEQATDLGSHLVHSRLAGAVSTSPRSTIENSYKVVRGDREYTFGLNDWKHVTADEVLDAVRSVCGRDPADTEDLDGSGWIDPDATLRGIAVHCERVRAFAAGGGRVLLATGHPTGLLAHYGGLARALQHAGNLVLAPLDDRWVDWDKRGRRLGVRYVDGVATVFDGASLRHTHRSVFMESMLGSTDVSGVDLVIADHGMAGAAIAAGIPTLSIADVNDPALPLAQVRGHTDGVLPIDDNLAPSVYVPVTEAMLDWR